MLLINCQKEDEQVFKKEREITLKILDFSELRTNQRLIDKIESINTRTTNRNALDIYYNAAYGFEIDTNIVNYVESEDYHSYSFSITRDNPKDDKLENLFLSLNSEGAYDSYLVKYDLIQEELETLSDQEIANRDVSYTPIDFDSSTIVNRSSRTMQYICHTSWFLVGVSSPRDYEISHYIWASETTCGWEEVGGGSGSSGVPTTTGNTNPSGGGSSPTDNPDDSDDMISVPTVDDTVCPPGQVKNSNSDCIDDCTIFDEVINSVLKLEGGFVNDPADPGGATNKGITWNVWKENATSVLGINPTLSNLMNLTTNQAKQIYKSRFWDAISADGINDGDIRHMLFDFYVNSASNAIIVLQETLNQLGQSVSVDGSIGPLTINAINNSDHTLLYNTLKINRINYYNKITQKSINRYLSKHPNATPSQINLRTYKRFINGWINRANHFINKTLTNNLFVNC